MEQISKAELAQQIAKKLKESVPLKMIREQASDKGFSKEEIDIAMSEAHDLIQQQADRDPVLRLILGPALLAIAFVCFYTDWAGRSVGIASFLGLIFFLIGGRLVWSLIKMWMRKK